MGKVSPQSAVCAELGIGYPQQNRASRRRRGRAPGRIPTQQKPHALTGAWLGVGPGGGDQARGRRSGQGAAIRPGGGDQARGRRCRQLDVPARPMGTRAASHAPQRRLSRTRRRALPVALGLALDRRFGLGSVWPGCQRPKHIACNDLGRVEAPGHSTFESRWGSGGPRGAPRRRPSPPDQPPPAGGTRGPFREGSPGSLRIPGKKPRRLKPLSSLGLGRSSKKASESVGRGLTPGRASLLFRLPIERRPATARPRTTGAKAAPLGSSPAL
jgi:hypothetical protein